jgi:hypothetical protein
MSETDYVYCLPEPGGETDKKIRDFQSKRTAAWNRCVNEMKRLGASNGRLGSRIVAVTFDDPTKVNSVLWKASRKYPGEYEPNGKTAQGKELARGFSTPEMTIPGNWEFHALFDPKDSFVSTNQAGPRGGFYIRFANYETIADKLVLSIPLNPEGKPGFPVPADCKQLKMSEYFALKEGAEAVK